LAVHLDAKLAVAGIRNLRKLDFEILPSQQILDRNSNVRFHKSMVTTGLQKSSVHDSVHSPSYINRYAALTSHEKNL
jgi:hypothetical protein